jgi:hypothetical protein
MRVLCREALTGSAHQVKDRERRGHATPERKFMDPQEIIEEPQDRTGSWGGRHAEYTPQGLAGGRS